MGVEKHQVADRLGLLLTDATCSGATTDNILVSGQHEEPAQILSVTPDTNLVTITIGGNDVSHPNLAGMTAVADQVIEAVRDGRIVEVGNES